MIIDACITLDTTKFDKTKWGKIFNKCTVIGQKKISKINPIHIDILC